ncbi:zinc-ribbon domain-containing protein [Candidatus Ventrimonas sp. KK005]
MEVKGIFNKSMKALKTNEGVKIGAVIVKKNKEDIELPVILCKVSCNIVDENGSVLGMLGECRYNNRKVYQYISREKAEEIGLKANTSLKPYVVRIKKGGRGGKGESMSLISYVVLKDNERGNKLLREYNYEKNKEIGIDVMKVAYQNSTVKLNWICEVCGKKFETLLNNRVGHTKTDCECFRSFYTTSTNEELVALMLKRSLPNLEVQVPVFGDRRRVDMAFETEAGKFIVEYDGPFHDKDKDYERDKEAKELGYINIRIVEIAQTRINIDRVDLIDSDMGGYAYETDTHTVVNNYFKYKDEIVALNNMFEYLTRILRSNGVDIKAEKVTSEIIKEAENSRKKYQKKVEIH